jgi:LmbE family N-acetylglucosaminyl deacetylase
VLCIGAHCDDIEIGCGASLQWLRTRWPGADVRWLVLSADGPRRAEAETGARLMLGDAAADRVSFGSFRDGFLPYEGAAVKQCFEQMKRRVDPDLILTHYRGDLHQDHRLAGELTWNTWRDHLILEYEIPKYDGDLGRPNCFLPVSSAQLEEKIRILLEVYASQRAKAWFTAETFRGLARLRGVESNSPSGYAEAFHVPKLVLRTT